MIYEPTLLSVVVFAVFVAITLGLSFYFGRRARSAQGFFAASGGIPWFINGVAFAGDYLSAASFLGICGMIAFYGYDGFLYSIGYLAGWVVALFVIAEPLKRLGKYTLADALDSKFQSRGIRLAAAISTLAVSLFYLIPQMVGAGALIRPLLGLPHFAGVLIVGFVVVLIVATAGMVSTTWVQFLKGSLLVVFCTVLTGMILNRGLFVQRAPIWVQDEERAEFDSRFWTELPNEAGWQGKPYARFRGKNDLGIPTDGFTVTMREGPDRTRKPYLRCQTVTIKPDGTKLVDGTPQGGPVGCFGAGHDLDYVGELGKLPADVNTIRIPSTPGWWDTYTTGPLAPWSFLSVLQRSEVILWSSEKITEADGSVTTVYYPKPTAGSDVLRPGTSPLFPGLSNGKFTDQLNFISLMLALFCGTASLPHILIRYYTVKDQASARKSTVVGIGAIGFFYILTLFIGLGAMTSGALDVTNSNMAAPLLARSFGEWPFAIISAIAFTTVLGTVSGLIVASCGAVVHDLLSNVMKWELTDREKVRIGKLAAVAVGVIAIVLGILFEKMNVNFLVGWAFSVAASANLPSLIMLLFWKRTTKQGITAAIVVGMVSSLAWILLSGDTFKDVYGLPAESAPVPFSQPGIVTIPLGFVVLVAVSLCTRKS